MKILVTGATGFVGSRLVKLLIERGHSVNALSTRPNARVKGATTFIWNPDELEIDEAALAGVEAIIHLAGATVNHRWTTKYKQEIVTSRTLTGETLFRAIAKAKNHNIKSFISASAVGYYPSDFEKNYTEDASPGSDFLAQVCVQWEAAADKMKQLNLRVAKLRIGIVLGQGGGVLGQLELPTKLGLAAPLATGKQWMSWIHLEDLCRLFVYAIENESVNGAINAGGSQPVTNKTLSKVFANVMGRPFWAPAVPAFALKLALGEMATLALMSQKVSDAKTKALGFQYKYNEIAEALKDLYQKG